MEPMEDPPVSVVMPVWNRAGMVREALAGFLEPSASIFEVVVVDDGSTDSTADEVLAAAAASRGARISLVRQANAGPGAARNRGAQEARGRWLAFLDSDDLWLPWTPRILLQSLIAAGDPAFAFLQTHVFADVSELASIGESPVDVVEHPDLYTMRLNAPLAMIGSCNMVVRKDVFEAVGGFTTEVRSGEDTDLFFRCGNRGPCVSIVAPVLLGYRSNSPDSLSKQAGATEQAIHFILSRHRAGAYPGPDAVRDQTLLKSARITIRNFFATGHPSAAYRVFAASVPLMLSQRDWHHLFRLPLTPLLSLLRPANHRFRWRP